MDRFRALSSSSVFKRTMLIMVLFGVVAFAVLVGKLFEVQVIAFEEYQGRAISQQTRNEIITPSRGIIYDANMNELAISATVETVCISPNDIPDAETAAKIAAGLSRILGVDYDTVYKRATEKGSYYSTISRNIEPDLAAQVRQFIIDEKLHLKVFLVDSTKRYYPRGTLASQILGFIGTDNNGLYGIEYTFEDTLQGTPGRIIAAKNARGTDMPFEYEQYYDAEDGDSIVLTIDVVIQNYLEQALEKARENANAQKGVTGIVMDVTNGEILAMSSKPDYDPNDPFIIKDGFTNEGLSVYSGEEYTKALNLARMSMWNNRAIGDTYEPGSVFKVITGAMALEENVTTLNDNSFYCRGPKSIEIYDREIGCWRNPGHGVQSFADGVKNSCNPVFINLGFRLGATNFFKYFEAFGFTARTNINLQGEARTSTALYHDESYLSRVPVALATCTFGQTFNVTPIQMITAVSTVVNGGILYEPHIVNRVLSPDGTEKLIIPPKAVRNVVTPRTSRDMCTALELVVSEGTGSNAYVKGYKVGGKTGTTVKTETNEDAQRLYISSFVGFAPADDPKIAVLILVDEPAVYTHSGNMLAAPYVAEVLEKTLLYLGIDPIYTPEEYAMLDITMPDLTGMTAEEVALTAKNFDFDYTVKGSGDVVTDQMPSAGAVVPRNAQMVVYMGGQKPNYTITVPNIVGMTLSGIRNLLKNSEFYIRPVGNTMSNTPVLSVNQYPEYGSVVEPGTVITVSFIKDTSNEDIW